MKKIIVISVLVVLAIIFWAQIAQVLQGLALGYYLRRL